MYTYKIYISSHCSLKNYHVKFIFIKKWQTSYYASTYGCGATEVLGESQKVQKQHHFSSSEKNT